MWVTLADWERMLSLTAENKRAHLVPWKELHLRQHIIYMTILHYVEEMCRKVAELSL